MTTESARMATAHEAAFRVQYPNSRGRITRIIALDRAGAATVGPLVEGFSERTSFFSVAPIENHPSGHETGKGALALVDGKGHTVQLSDVIDGADMVVMVAVEGGNADAASAIGNACRLAGLMTTALILTASDTVSEVLSARTLKSIRPHASMIVLADDVDYITDMLSALRA